MYARYRTGVAVEEKCTNEEEAELRKGCCQFGMARYTQYDVNVFYPIYSIPTNIIIHVLSLMFTVKLFLLK